MGKLRVVSLFAGCGGTDLGFLGGFEFLGARYKEHPVEIVYANDCDRGAADIFDLNFDIDCTVKDVRDVKISEIPKHDILTGGFPCQSFSIVAQNPPRLGFQGEGGLLFKEMCRVLKQLRPSAFIAENVKGILSANSKKAFPLILEEFRDCGYIVNWRLYNAAEYGVPQKRERVFIVGIRKDLGRKFIHPEPTHSLFDALSAEPAVPLKAVILSTKRVPQKYFFSEKAIAGLAKANKQMNKGRAQNISQPCGTVGAHLAKVSLNSTDPVLKVSNGFRRFTPREVARIQSFPDSFELTGPDTRQYRALGNAIPPVLMWHIADSLIKTLRQKKRMPYELTDVEKRSFNMARIRGKDTSIEIQFRKALWDRGMRYRVNPKGIYGKPDIVFQKSKVAIFCDSSFWHGKDFPDSVERIKTRQEYWQTKIERNIERDEEVVRELEKSGWKVLRFWDSDIQNGFPDCVAQVEAAVKGSVSQAVFPSR